MLKTTTAHFYWSWVCVRHCSMTYFIFIKLVRGKYYCFHFTKEKTMAQRLIICPKSDSWLIILQYWGKTLLGTITKTPWIMRFSSHIAGGNRYYPQPCVSTEYCFLQSFQPFFPSLRWFPHFNALITIQLNILWERSEDVWSSFSVKLSFPVLCTYEL